MSTQLNNLLDNLYGRAQQATETGLQLQQSLLLEWTRCLPGFTARGPSVSDRYGQLQEAWSRSVLSTARAQRELLDQQFDLAINSLDFLVGAGVESSEPVAEAEAPASTAAQPVAEKSPPLAGGEKAKPVPSPPEREVAPELPVGAARNIYQKVAVVTGAASGIGAAVARDLAERGARAVMLVDRSEGVEDLAKTINEEVGREVAVAKVGDTTDEGFRKRVFNDADESYGMVTIVVPAAGITRDALSVRIDKETGKAQIYPAETFRQVTEVNLLAPIYWGIEMVARIAEDRKRRGLKRWEPAETIQGVVVFLGSVSSQGNKGQISYAVAKAGLEGAAATLTKEAIFHGVRCGIIHPGFTDTPMARALGQDFLDKHVLPYTQLRRLIRPEEIADAICFMISNSAVSGELWCDAGWHPPA